MSRIPTAFLTRMILVGSLPFVGCDQIGSKPTEAKAEKPIAVVQAETMIVEPRVWPFRIRTQGSLIADEMSSIGTKVPGRILAVHVDLGDRVEKDAPLIAIDAQQYELQVAQAEAQLNQARSAVGLRDSDPVEKLNPENAPPVREAKAVWDQAKQAVDRTRRLSAQNAISATDLEIAVAAEDVASARFASALNGVREKIAMIGVQSAQLGLAKQNLVDTVILAPFAGVIQTRQVGVGTYIQSGQSLMTLVRTSPLRFRAAVPERYAQDLRIGQKLELTLELSHQKREVKVSRLSPALDPLSRALSFEALVDNRDQSLRSGLFAEAEVVLDENAMAIVIPTAAIMRFAGVDKVWKLDGEMLREQPIRIGRQEGELSEITFGLKAADTILQNGSQGKVGRLEAMGSKP